MRAEQVDGEATYLVGQVTACFMINAARFGAQLDRLGDLIPIARHGIEFVHIGLDGSFTRVSRITGGFDQLVDVLCFLLQEALGFHFVAVDEVIDQFGRVILTTQRGTFPHNKSNVGQWSSSEFLRQRFGVHPTPLAKCRTL